MSKSYKLDKNWIIFINSIQLYDKDYKIYQKRKNMRKDIDVLSPQEIFLSIFDLSLSENSLETSNTSKQIQNPDEKVLFIKFNSLNF